MANDNLVGQPVTPTPFVDSGAYALFVLYIALPPTALCAAAPLSLTQSWCLWLAFVVARLVYRWGTVRRLRHAPHPPPSNFVLGGFANLLRNRHR